jgi:hypothetical protein
LGYGHFVLCEELDEIIPVYAIVTFRQPERGQTIFFNPAQYRYGTHPAMLGNETGSDISWTPVLFSCLHVSLLVIVCELVSI